MASILYVDDDLSVGLILHDVLERSGHVPSGATNVRDALEIVSRGGIDLIISDYRMPGTTGIEFLNLLAHEGYDIPLIMLTGHGSIEHAVASIKAGAIDYITKPLRSQQLGLAVDQALEFVRLRRENDSLRRELTELRTERPIIGESQAIRRVLQTVALAAPTRATVLLQGESGTGKELFARAIHDQSDRRNRPFIQLNCAALPEGLIESALFGHERGAFTGAVKRVEGAVERAHHGTLLLDEVSELRVDLQAKLLRVLQEQEFDRVGGTSPVRVDVRIIATTNRDLAAEAATGAFRRDLYYRLGVIPIVIPPLRERRGDIPLLAMRFALKIASELKKDVRGLAADAIAHLQAQDWPGNVRELQHAVERAVILSSDPIIQAHAFDIGRFGFAPTVALARTPVKPPADSPARAALVPPSAPMTISPWSGPQAMWKEPTLPEDDPKAPAKLLLNTFNVAEAERVLIAGALAVTAGNRTRAADLLGISARTLRNKLNTPNAGPTGRAATG
jgi:DNA-binding NtrC family response regulator